MTPKETGKQIEADSMPMAPGVSVPLWRRIPTGWIVLALFIASWAGVILIWRGLMLLGGN